MDENAIKLSWDSKGKIFNFLILLLDGNSRSLFTFFIDADTLSYWVERAHLSNSVSPQQQNQNKKWKIKRTKLKTQQFFWLQGKQIHFLRYHFTRILQMKASIALDSGTSNFSNRAIWKIINQIPNEKKGLRRLTIPNLVASLWL